MRVALRHGEEPFMAGNAPDRAGRAIRQRLRARGVGSNVAAALLFRHAHADQQAALLIARQRVGVVAIAEQRVAPAAESVRQPALQQRYGGVRHGRRTERAGLDLSVENKARGARHHGAIEHVGLPAEIMQSAGADALHQQVPRGMKTDLVDAYAARVVAQQLRRRGVGQPS